MNWEQARRFCASLPGATQDIKWGADLCFCIGGRMFAVTWLDARGKAQRFSFKVDDHRFLELTDRAGIVPAPYLARAKWVQVQDAGALTDAQARALLARSHALVAARLTRAQQRALGLLDAAAPAARPAAQPRATRSTRSTRSPTN
jgi:predicted DNA-binding protein (MmcQ/YjbR family)